MFQLIAVFLVGILVGILVGQMEVKSKIFKRKTGKSKGKWVVRLEYYDDLKGKRCFLERHFSSKGEATDKRNILIDEIKKTHGQVTHGDKMNFNVLADIAEINFYQPAEIIQGRKVSGVRSPISAKAQLNNLRRFFGRRPLREITTESLYDYRLHRLKKTGPDEKKTISIATVNRELAMMRKIMRFAYGKGWILKDIFFNAKIIDHSAELERTRLLTHEEEQRLLDACKGERTIKYKRKKRGKPEEIEEVTMTVSADNPQLKAIILLALDSGLRRGEILKLRWQDFDLENNLIHVQGTHTKTERPRIVPLSERTKNELEQIPKMTSEERPFPFNSIKRSFATAKRLADIDDLRFHDLRRTAITRWIQQGNPLALAGKLAGHSQLQTTMKHYTSTDVAMVKEIAEKMNAHHAQKKKSG